MDNTQPFGVTPKQNFVLEQVRDSPINGIDEIFLIGPIGSTKTFVMAYAHINIAYQYNDCIIPVGRKDAAEHQLGTFAEYMKALRVMGLVEGVDYTTRQAPADTRIKFTKTASIIQFVGMNKSRDPEFAKLKITATCAGVDEVDDVDEGGYIMLQSRTGRRNEQGAPRIMISCCNPNDRWTKHKIYLPWLKATGQLADRAPDVDPDTVADLPKNIMVVEFTMEDSPLFYTGYYDPFMDRANAWQQRYLRNNWNYFDDDSSLFKVRTLDMLTVNTIKRGTKYIGVDPNAGGTDRAVICLWEGDTLVDMWVYTTKDLEKEAEPDELNPFNAGAILGRLTIKIAEKEGVGWQHIGGDVVGIGQGWLTHMLSKGWKVRQFRAGDAPFQTPEQQRKNIKPPYNMLRSQVFHMLALATENSQAYFYSGCPFLASAKKELLLHNYDETAKVLAVEKKDEIKKRLGGDSPDIADSVVIGWWVKMINEVSAATATQKGSIGKTYEEMYNNFR